MLILPREQLEQRVTRNEDMQSFRCQRQTYSSDSMITWNDVTIKCQLSITQPNSKTNRRILLKNLEMIDMAKLSGGAARVCLAKI